MRMRILPRPFSRTAVTVSASVVAVAGMTAIALAASGATASKAPRVKVKCPALVTSGKKVTCRLFGRLPQGPAGPHGPEGPERDKRAESDKNPPGDTAAQRRAREAPGRRRVWATASPPN